MPRQLTRMIYVDDSGFDKTGVAVFGWIEFSPEHWPHVLRSWLDVRKGLWRDYRIAVPTELHATHFVNGRGRISQRIPDRYIHDGVEYWKDLGRDVARECLDALGSIEGLSVGAVYARTTPSAFHDGKRQLYAALVDRLEAELGQTGELALVFMDGDGTDPSYRSTHRSLKLNARRVIEDAIHIDSSQSQLVQMADLVAWSAYVSIDRYEGHAFAWDWYAHYLAVRDPARKPQRIDL